MTTLEKIRAEIDEYLSPVFIKSNAKCQECANHLHDDVLQIINKHAEQEPMREFTKEEAKAYSKALDKMYKPTGFNVFNEPCDDAISRQAVLDCATLITSIPTEDWDIGDWVCLFRDRVSQLPSVRLQEKIGHWIDDEFGSKCSCCGIHTHLDKFDRPMKFKHCSMCGARMVEPQEKRCADCNHYGKFSLVCGRCDDDCSMYESQESEEKDDTRWCNTCEFKYLESECLGCAEYDEYDNLINLRNYKKEG